MYSKTWTESARSIEASSSGSGIASPSTSVTFLCPSVLRAATASIEALGSMPVTLAACSASAAT